LLNIAKTLFVENLKNNNYSMTIEELRHLFMSYLQDNTLTKTPSELYEPVNYIMNLGGKRLRPIMLLMAYELFDDEVKIALPAAYAIEIFHNFSLVHDDIMDEAPLRRGKPTVHKKFDTNTGILSGDVMLILAYESLMKTQDTAKLPKLVRLFNDTAIKVCEGQQMDMNFETSNEVSIPEYLKMISYKTAALLAGGMKMGALIADASVKNADWVFDFGWNIGIAFQLQDDILDTYGDPEKFGKKVGGDIAQNKKTYLVLRALELADEVTANRLRELMGTNPPDEKEKIKTVKTIFDSLKIREEAEKLKNIYQDKAFAALNAVDVDSAQKKALISIANQLMGRET